MTFKSVVRDLCPPAIPKLVSRLRPPPKSVSEGNIVFTGNYQSWEEAERASTGYADAEILARTRAAILKVKRGEAAFERDSVTFQVMEHRFPLLAGLLRAASATGGRLSVVDFGGALGSTYFQCRQFLSVVKELRWNVVEQPSHVACGQAELSDERLRFYSTIAECLASERPDLLLMSGVLQYLPQPYVMLKSLLMFGLDRVILDRVAILNRDEDRLTVQTVPESIYPASYPAWFFSESRFRTVFRDTGYTLVAEFPGFDILAPVDEQAHYKGFILDRHSDDRGTIVTPHVFHGDAIKQGIHVV